MKNILGNNSNMISKIKFTIKEYNRIYSPKVNKIIANIKTYMDNFIEYYNNYSYITLFIAWYITILLFPKYKIFLSIMVLITAFLTILNTAIRNKHEQFYLTADFSKTINELDSLIADCIQEYISMNAMENQKFFSIEDEKKLRSETTNMVSAKMSQILYKKLCIVYNKNIVYDVIGARIYLIISKFVYETNTKPNYEKKK